MQHFPSLSLVCGVLLAPAGSGLAPAAEASKPNIVIILADDYGWGSASCYGAKGVETPNIDRLAKEGRRFTNAYAPGSVCSPTRYGLMTGRYYWRTSIKDGEVLPVGAPLHIETSRTTLGSLCKGRGYATAAIGKWHLGWTAEPVLDWSKPLKPGPLDLGFDYYFGMAANLPNGPHSFIENRGVTGHVAGQPIIVNGSGQKATSTGIKKPWEFNRVMETITARATQWIESNRAAPFFLYFAPNAVHGPIVPNPRFTGNRLGKYGDFIRELDWSVGEVLATLDRLNLADHTLVIFTSDNGGETHGADAQVAAEAGLAINGPLRGGKHSEWEGGFREPFIVRWPGRVPAATESYQVICLTDMLATFGDVLRVPLTRGNAEDSFSVLRAFTEAKPGQPIRDHVILQASDHATYTIRMGDWKLVERIGAPQFEPRETKRSGKTESEPAPIANHDELFNLAADPAESKDVSAEHGAVVAKLKQRLVESRDHGCTRPGAN